MGAFTKNSMYAMKIHSIQCIIDDVIHGEIIGRAELQNGWYYLVFPIVSSVCNSVSIVNKSTLWHARPGHASYSKLQCLQRLEPIIQINKNLICDYCHFAKQKRLPFQFSSSISANCFFFVACGYMGSLQGGYHSWPSLFPHHIGWPHQSSMGVYDEGEVWSQRSDYKVLQLEPMWSV